MTMITDTRSANSRMHVPGDCSSVWLFGYGSLIFKADFDYQIRRPARISGWARRFWQGSHDHRGTPQAPGRVLTLIRCPGAVCQGMAYLVSPAVFEQLDVREKNGYLRLGTELVLDDDSEVRGLVYIATENNAAYLGAASDAEIAAQVARSAGPSGPNRDYVLQLADALRALDCDDPHVFAVERQLRLLGAGVCTG